MEDISELIEQSIDWTALPDMNDPLECYFIKDAYLVDIFEWIDQALNSLITLLTL